MLDPADRVMEPGNVCSKTGRPWRKASDASSGVLIAITSKGQFKAFDKRLRRFWSSIIKNTGTFIASWPAHAFMAISPPIPAGSPMVSAIGDTTSIIRADQ